MYKRECLVAFILISIQLFPATSSINHLVKNTTRLRFFNETLFLSVETVNDQGDNSSSEDQSNGFNNLHKLPAESHRHPLPYTVLIILTYAIVFAIGMVGNCMVISVIAVKPEMKTATNIFLLNLAAADTFILTFCLPVTLLTSIYTPWILGHFLCKAITYVQGVSVVASSYSLVAVTIERCKVICRSSLPSPGFTDFQVTLTIILIWLFSLILPIPWIFVFRLETDEDGIEYCYEDWPDKHIGIVYFLSVNLFVCYILPAVAVALANIFVWWKVSHRNIPQTDNTSVASLLHTRGIHRRTSKGVGKVLGVVTFAYLLCWLPLYLLATMVQFSSSPSSSKEQSVLDICFPFAQFLAYWNSCINPVFYGFLNSRFRKIAKTLFPEWLVTQCCTFSGNEEKRLTRIAIVNFTANPTQQYGLSKRRVRASRGKVPGKNSDQLKEHRNTKNTEIAKCEIPNSTRHFKATPV